MSSRGIALFGIVALVRILVIFLCPSGLAGDEAYYWEWGRHPAWGYYSKPPGIAWIMALAGWLGNDSAIGIRLTAAVFSMGTGWWIYLLCRQLHGERVAVLGAALFFVTPAAAALGFLLTIDAPVMFFWSAALYFFFASIDTERPPSRWNLIALALSIAGGVLTKQMMMVFPLLAVVVLFLQKKSPFASRSRIPLLAALFLPFLVLLPPLLWNAEHDWPTLRHSSEHFSASTENGPLPILGRLGEFLASQLLLASPVIGALIALLLIRTVRKWRGIDTNRKALWLFCAPGIAAMLVATSWQRINPNWPVVFYVAGIVLCAAWLSEKLPSHLRWRRWSLGTAASLTVILYLGLALTSWQLGPPSLQAQSQRLHGWSQLAAEVQKLRNNCPHPDKTILITRSHRFLTSQLAFQLPDHPRVYRYAYENTGSIDSQHAYWPGPETALGCDALVVSAGKSGRLPSALSRRFESVEKIAVLENFDAVAGGPVSIFLGRNLREWTAPGDGKVSWQ